MPARIAHLSDIHFGANDAKIVDSTVAWLQEQRPDLVIISGDFTQRARIAQFRQAAAWLNRLRADGHNILAVPGNHDVPLYDVVRRFAAPLRRYKRWISSDLCPWFESESVAVLGINTARSLTFRDGRINHDQMKLIERSFAAVAPEKTRILVTHHPLFAMPIGRGGELSEAVGRHEDAVKAVCRARDGRAGQRYCGRIERAAQCRGGFAVPPADLAFALLPCRRVLLLQRHRMGGRKRRHHRRFILAGLA